MTKKSSQSLTPHEPSQRFYLAFHPIENMEDAANVCLLCRTAVVLSTRLLTLHPVCMLCKFLPPGLWLRLTIAQSFVRGHHEWGCSSAGFYCPFFIWIQIQAHTTVPCFTSYIWKMTSWQIKKYWRFWLCVYMCVFSSSLKSKNIFHFKILWNLNVTKNSRTFFT